MPKMNCGLVFFMMWKIRPGRGHHRWSQKASLHSVGMLSPVKCSVRMWHDQNCALGKPQREEGYRNYFKIKCNTLARRAYNKSAGSQPRNTRYCLCKCWPMTWMRVWTKRHNEWKEWNILERPCRDTEWVPNSLNLPCFSH